MQAASDSISGMINVSEQTTKVATVKLHEWEQSVDGALHMFDQIIQANSDNASALALKVQAEVTNEQKMNHKYGADVTSAVRPILTNKIEFDALKAISRKAATIAVGRLRDSMAWAWAELRGEDKEGCSVGA